MESPGNPGCPARPQPILGLLFILDIVSLGLVPDPFVSRADELACRRIGVCRQASRESVQASMSTTASIVPGAFPSSRLFTNRKAGTFRRLDSSVIRRIPSRAPSFGSWIVTVHGLPLPFRGW